MTARVALGAAVLAITLAGCAIAERSDRIEIGGSADLALSPLVDWLPRVSLEAAIIMEDSSHAPLPPTRSARPGARRRGML